MTFILEPNYGTLPPPTPPQASLSLPHVTDVSLLSTVGFIRELFEKGLRQAWREKMLGMRPLGSFDLNSPSSLHPQ